VVENTVEGIVFPLQTSILVVLFTCADGFTVIVKVCVKPEQVKLPLVNDGVTEIVAVMGDNPLLTAVKFGIFPVPDADKPILGVSFAQLYEVVPPVVVFEKFIADEGLPLQIVLFGVATKLAFGKTEITNCFVVPLQEVVPVKIDGVTIIVALTIVVPLFIAVKEGKSPVPEAANPIEGLEFVQV
jgi:hypothetical protein